MSQVAKMLGWVIHICNVIIYLHILSDKYHEVGNVTDFLELSDWLNKRWNKRSETMHYCTTTTQTRKTITRFRHMLDLHLMHAMFQFWQTTRLHNLTLTSTSNPHNPLRVKLVDPFQKLVKCVVRVTDNKNWATLRHQRGNVTFVIKKFSTSVPLQLIVQQNISDLKWTIEPNVKPQSKMNIGASYPG